MKTTFRYLFALIGCGLGLMSMAQSSSPNLIIITADGLRWQEIFKGVDQDLIDTSTGASILSREQLMPFVWNTFSKEGNLYGNRDYLNFVNTRNYHRFSYPGYNEIFCGLFEPNVDSNKKSYNKNVSILEDLNGYGIYKNRIAAFTSWEVFPYILNEPRSGVIVNAGWETIETGLITPAIFKVNKEIDSMTSTKNETRADDLTWRLAMAYAKANHPKVLFVSLDDTDHYGHKADYPAYVNAIARFDMYLKEIWTLIQSDPFYQNNTYLLVTTDHGRGSTLSSWRNHGLIPVRSGETWYMEYGPGIRSGGEIMTAMQQYQADLAYIMMDYLKVKFVAHKLPLLPEKKSEVLLASFKF